MTDSDGNETHGAYWDAIRSRVCSVCLDQANDGTCGLGRRRVCAIEAHLPRLVEVLSSIDSPRMDEYVAAVEAEICGRCAQQDSGGKCELRDEGTCALYTTSRSSSRPSRKCGERPPEDRRWCRYSAA